MWAGAIPEEGSTWVGAGVLKSWTAYAGVWVDGSGRRDAAPGET